LDSNGRVENAAEVGPAFVETWKFLSERVSIVIFPPDGSVQSSLSPSMNAAVSEITKRGESAALILVHEPPEELSLAIRTITDERFKGLMTLWGEKRFTDKLPMEEHLRRYLHTATVDFVATGDQPEVLRAARVIDATFEKADGFEDRHWLRLIKGSSQNEKAESLREALTVCVPIVVAIKGLESFAPGAMHVVGGVLDDLFGAIVPDVSHSMGRRDLPWRERLKEALPVLKGGAVSLPAAMGLGWLSAHIYSPDSSLPLRMLAGGLFALACCGGR
jgi:hypothetical protein